jgi:hypothetical protein
VSDPEGARIADYAWLERMGLRDLDRVAETASRLAASYECTTPAYGAPGHPHCAACCYGTMIAATSMEEFETAQVLLAVPELVQELRRLRALIDGLGAGGTMEP